MRHKIRTTTYKTSILIDIEHEILHVQIVHWIYKKSSRVDTALCLNAVLKRLGGNESIMSTVTRRGTNFTKGHKTFQCHIKDDKKSKVKYVNGFFLLIWRLPNKKRAIMVYKELLLMELWYPSSLLYEKIICNTQNSFILQSVIYTFTQR